jgi:hypothetical protein
MLFAIFLVAAVTLTSVSLVKKEPFSALISTLLWALTAGAAYISHEAVWDIYYMAFFGFIILALSMGIYSAIEFAADADKGGDIFEDGHRSKRKQKNGATSVIPMFASEKVEFSTDYQSLIGEVRAMRGELRGGVKRTSAIKKQVARRFF